jgi:gamma-D-glutamyl-L-lysine dipeptidyl-peptidase
LPEFGICNLAIVPLRFEPSDRSEMVSQVLFGDCFEILEHDKQWIKIKLNFDQYQGWIDSKQQEAITEIDFKTLTKIKPSYCADLVAYASLHTQLMPIPFGASLTHFLLNENELKFSFDGKKISGKKAKKQLIATAHLYLNAPYLWGGKTPFGIDCSGFTQMVYKLNGYKIDRDASQQANQGQALSFIEESEPGDLAFFDNEEGKITHVGIMMDNNYIIHASGKVRIDRIDHLGIFNAETNRHTHKLRVIKKII